MRGHAWAALAPVLIGLCAGEIQQASGDTILHWADAARVGVGNGPAISQAARRKDERPGDSMASVAEMGTRPMAVGDGKTDNCQAITSAISAASADVPVALTFGPGIFYSSCSISISGHSVSIRGAGKSATELRFGNTNGFVIAIAGPQTVDFSDAAVTTTAIAANTGLAISYAPSGFANRELTHVNLRSFVIKGVSREMQSWKTAISLNDTNAVRINDIDIIGTNGPRGTTEHLQAENTATPYGLVLTGSHFPTDIKIAGSVFQSLKYGVYADNTNLEGLQVAQSTFLLTDSGIRWVTGPTNQGRPQLLALGNHFNVYTSAIEAIGISESTISKNLFYHNERSTNPATLISLLGTGSVSIMDNEFESFLTAPSLTTTGISVDVAPGGYPVPASYLTTIAYNVFGAQSPHFALGISLKKGVISQYLSHNRFGPGVTTAISDASDAGFGQQTAYGRNIATLKLSHSLVVPSGELAAVVWDTQVNGTPGWVVSASLANRIAVAANRPFTQARCSAHVRWAGNPNGMRRIAITKNGTDFPGMASSTALPTPRGVAQEQDAGSMAITPVSAGDYFELVLTQTSGEPIALEAQSSWFQCESIE